MLVWFVLIASIGLYNMIKYYPPVLKAISPHYIYMFFAKNKKVGWEQLGTVVLCITGKTCKVTALFLISTRNMQYNCIMLFFM
jgi:KUP system potassium uptake protein